MDPSFSGTADQTTGQRTTLQEDNPMPRYIFIDRNSGYIWGDSADIDGKIVTGTPCEVAAALDKSIGDLDGDVEYDETFQSDPHVTYDVYRADINGSEAVTVITDGQDQEMIDAVQRDCKFATSIRRIVRQDAL